MYHVQDPQIVEIAIVDNFPESLVLHCSFEVHDHLLVIILLFLLGCDVFKEKLAKRTALASDDAHVGCDLNVAASPLLLFKKLRDFLLILISPKTSPSALHLPQHRSRLVIIIPA